MIASNDPFVATRCIQRSYLFKPFLAPFALNFNCRQQSTALSRFFGRTTNTTGNKTTSWPPGNRTQEFASAALSHE